MIGLYESALVGVAVNIEESDPLIRGVSLLCSDAVYLLVGFFAV